MPRSQNVADPAFSDLRCSGPGIQEISLTFSCPSLIASNLVEELETISHATRRTKGIVRSPALRAKSHSCNRSNGE